MSCLFVGGGTVMRPSQRVIDIADRFANVRNSRLRFDQMSMSVIPGSLDIVQDRRFSCLSTSTSPFKQSRTAAQLVVSVAFCLQNIVM